MDHWQQAWCVRSEHFPPQVVFCRPMRTLAVSLTGTSCAMHCAHCGGHYLKGMVDIEHADGTGMTSCLISGGCDRRGRVPVTSRETLVAALRPGRLMNWHTGMIDEDDMRAIAPYVDVVSFDFVGDDDVIREVYGLDCSVDDYVRTYAMLRRHAAVVPHLTLGLHAGRLCGEEKALDLLREAGIEALAVLVFVPTRGTLYAHSEPPALSEVADFLLMARRTLPDTPIYLGCMRPGGAYRRELDVLALRAGVNKIVNPTPPAVRLATELGLQIKWENECCVFQRA